MSLTSHVVDVSLTRRVSEPPADPACPHDGHGGARRAQLRQPDGAGRGVLLHPARLHPARHIPLQDTPRVGHLHIIQVPICDFRKRAPSPVMKGLICSESVACACLHIGMVVYVGINHPANIHPVHQRLRNLVQFQCNNRFCMCPF